MTTLPDSNPKTVCGLAKPSLAAVPPVGIYEVGRVMAHGAAKYGRMNWRDHSITASTYYDAALRHLMAWHDGQDTDPDSGLPHLAHAAAGLMIALDAASLGKLNDDRKTAGALPAFLAAHAEPTPAPAAPAVPLKEGEAVYKCVDNGGRPLSLTLGRLYVGRVASCGRNVILESDTGFTNEWRLDRFERVTP